MGTPRFRPASIFAKPRSFGRKVDARFVETPDLTPGERLWAIYQHRVAFEVLETLERRPGGLDRFAKELGVTPRWLQRLLYGRAPADLGAMLGWALVLEIEPPEFAAVLSIGN